MFKQNSTAAYNITTMRINVMTRLLIKRSPVKVMTEMREEIRMSGLYQYQGAH
jgi:hypothetical protein